MLCDGLSELSEDGAGRAVAAADLAQGLGFLRASNLQVMRLQLASERRDRRGVMAAIDELVGLDRELGRFIESIPGVAIQPIGVAQQRDVMEQRLILSRGKIGPAFRAEGATKPLVALNPAPREGVAEAYFEEPGPSRLPSLLVLLGLCCVAALALLYGLTGSLTAWLEFLR